nr:hypothetical protein [Streptomyces albicerus]
MAALASSHLRIQLDGHTDTVRHIAWSPDGRPLATASRDGTARIFDARSGRSLRVLPSGGAMVEGVAWSPDSTRIATVGRDHVVRIWDAASGEPLRSLTGAPDSSTRAGARWLVGSSRSRGSTGSLTNRASSIRRRRP